MSFCVDPNDLQRYLDGEMGEVDREVLEQHIEECPRCESRLEALSNCPSPEWPRPSRVPPPPSIPGFDIQAQLGVGGMGVVYLAYQAKLKRPVALKVILSWARITSERRERLKDEAVTAGRLGHANVVQVFDADEHEGVPYLVMEYCPGGCLAKELNGTPLPIRTASELVKTLAIAVHAVHVKGVVHCDLKPANILIAEDRTVKISDFGLARSFAEPGGPIGPSGGSPPYMAPEQLGETAGKVGVWTDIYALGAILYECLTGRPPFKGPTKQDTCEMVRTAEPVPPRRLQPNVPRGLEEICLKCLQKEPARRYATAEQLSEELRRFLVGEPLRHTRRVGPAELAWSWCRRHKALSAAGVLSVLLLAAAVAVPVAFAVRERRHNEDLARELRNSQYQRSVNDLEKGLKLLEEGNTRTGLLTLTRALQVAPQDADDLQRVIRTNLAGWAPLAGTLRQAPLAYPGLVSAAALRADGRMLVIGGADGVLRVWDLVEGVELRQIPVGKTQVRTVALSPDGHTVLTGDKDGIRLWNLNTGQEEERPLTITRSAVRAAAFSPDGARVLIGFGSGAACLCDLHTGEVTDLPRHREGTLRAVAFSPNGQHFVTGTFRKARLWSNGPGEPQLLKEMSPDGEVVAAVFGRDGTTVMTATTHDILEVWDTDDGDRLGPALWRGEMGKVVALAHGSCEQGVTVVTGNGFNATADGFKTIRIWDGLFSMSGRPVGSKGSTVHAAVFGWGGQFILMGRGGWDEANEGEARLLDAASREPRGPPLRHRRAVRVVAFHSDGRTVLTGSMDKTVCLWDATTGRRDCVLELTDEILAAAFSPNGARVLTVDQGGDACLWDVATGARVHGLTPPGHPVRAAIFSPDGRFVATGHEDGVIRLWGVATGVEQTSCRAGFGAVRALAFGLEGRLIAAGTNDGTVFLSEVGAGGALTPRPLGAGHGHGVTSLAFSPDGTTLLTVSWDRTARLWETATGQALRPDLLHRAGVCGAAMSPDGRTALTTAADGTVRVWDVASAHQLAPPIPHGDLCPVHQASFAPDGRSVLTASSNGHAWLWNLPRPLGGDVERLTLWVEVITGKQLDERGAYRDLDAAEWNLRHRRLAELGGPPIEDRGP